MGGGKGLDFTAPTEAELMKKIPENVKIVYTIKTIPAFLTGTIKKAIKDNSSFILHLMGPKPALVPVGAGEVPL